jgi:hypothetical protein
MKTFSGMTFAALLLASFVFGCKRRPETSGSGGAALTLTPEGASPGMVVRVTTSQPAFPDAKSARVDIGGEPAPISKWVSPTEVEVLVPNIAAGESSVKVTGGKVNEAAGFTVLPASAQELVLQLKDGALELVAVHPTADEPNMVTRSAEPQLSYDLVNPDGGLIFTGTIDHPAQARMELFDGPNAQQAILRREAPHPGHPVVFTVRLPVAPRGATVKFYESSAQLNLLDAAARQSRKLVGEIKLEK